MTPSPVIVEPCTELVGPLVTSSRDPLEMFSYFFNENFLHMIVHETNLFAAQSLAAANRNTTWETSIDELKAYLGFMIVMGVNRLPEVRDYWSRDEKLHNTFIASRITRDRFEEISVRTASGCGTNVLCSCISYLYYYVLTVFSFVSLFPSFNLCKSTGYLYT